MWLDEWRLFQLFAIQQGFSKLFSSRHPSSASLAGSEVPSSLAASPRGKPRCSCGSWFHSALCSVPSANGRLRRSGRQIGDPYSRLCKTMGLHHSPYDTPSVSPFGLTAPSEREPRALRACGRLRAAPTVGVYKKTVLRAVRYRAGQGTNVLAHARKRHCPAAQPPARFSGVAESCK